VHVMLATVANRIGLTGTCVLGTPSWAARKSPADSSSWPLYKIRGDADRANVARKWRENAGRPARATSTRMCAKFPGRVVATRDVNVLSPVFHNYRDVS